MTRQLLVTGMHRSGTSLLASAAARAGVDMGSRLMAASKGNRHGHFEDLDFVHFHEGLLESHGWSALRPPEGPLKLEPAEAAEARALIEGRAVSPLWGFKDPRAVLFLDVWNRLLPSPVHLLVYRHPVEVALSLLRRGLDVEAQLDPGVAVRAWTVYNAQLLDFHRAHRDRSVLWNVRAVSAVLPAAFDRLAEKLGAPLATAGLAELFLPRDLQTGLWGRGIDWPALLPEALDLYRRLEAAADLTGGPELDPHDREPQPSMAERELREATEHLLATALASRSEPPAPVETRLRVDYSELRLLAARQEESLRSSTATLAARDAEIRSLSENLKELATTLRRQDQEIRLLRQERDRREGEWSQVESTRGFRLLHSLWSVRTLGRSRLGRNGHPRPLRPAEVVVGCVTEDRSPFLEQALRLVQSIRWFGGGLARARVLVCVVEGIDPAAREAMERYGAEVRIVPRFDPRNGFANKLQLFAEALAAGAGTILLLDCDMVVVRDPLPLLKQGVFQGKTADVPSVTHDAFERLFRHFGLPLPERSRTTTLLGEPTIPYYNSAFVSLPAGMARSFVPVWSDYNRRILEVLDLLGTCAHHCHQASLSLALAAHPIPHEEAPVGINFPLHLTHLEPPPAMLESDPAILHYHSGVDAEGYILPTPYPKAQARVEQFNRRLREERRARK